MKRQMFILPPAPGLCQVCGADHPDDAAHNPQSLYYGTVFQATYGRGPTWADAVAHLAEDVRDRWRLAVLDTGADWTEPEGDPVVHLGDASAEAEGDR